MEDKVKNMEKQIARLARRSQKVAKVFTTAIPISGGRFEDSVEGDIFHYMFPRPGTISDIAIALLEKPQGTVNVTLEVTSGEDTTSRGTNLSKILTIIDGKMEIKKFDRLRVTLTASPDHPVSGVYVSFLWAPEVDSAKVQSFLIDELESIKESSL